MIEQVSNHVYVETGVPGCNHSLVVTGEGVVLIDTPSFSTEAVKWREEIKKFGRVIYIINSEPHIDHFSGNYFFEGTVVGHQGPREAILSTPVERYQEMMRDMAPPGLEIVKGFGFRPPTITFTDKLALYTRNHTFQLTNMPGHSPFQSPVYLPEEKVLFASDNVVYDQMPFITPQAQPFRWIESLKQMQKMDIKVLVPGHGRVVDKTYLPRMIESVQIWIDAVSEAIKKGMTKDEAKNSINLLDRYPVSSMPLERLTRLQHMNIVSIYKILTK